MTRTRASAAWAFAITAMPLFMVSLDNLVVTTALPVIKRSLGASLASLEWMVNAYTLTFAVLLLTGAALGDRFGRRRLFAIGLVIFTAGSAAAALAPSSGVLIAARAVQGLGGAIVIPLTLTILSSAVSPQRRALALGAWGGIGGLAIAVGPLVGGAIAQGVNWHWIFWLNVPVGIVAVALAFLRLQETRGPEGRLDLPGLALASGGLLGQGPNPFEAGLRVLPWTAMPAFVAPIAGLLAGRIGSRPILVPGLALMAIGLAWLAVVSSPTAPYAAFVPAFVVSGIGMGMFFAPIANVVLSAVYPEEEGKASGANNAIREVGGVFGVAVLASIFSANGSFASPQAYVDGLVPAVWVGAAVVGVAAVAALAIPARIAAGIRRPVTVPALARQRTDVDLAG